MKKKLMMISLVALAGAALAITGCKSMCPMKDSQCKMAPKACCGCGATDKADCKCPGGACAAKMK